MAKISQYQLDRSISGNDQLLGSDAENSNITRRFTVSDLAAYINGESSGSPGSGTVTSVSALTLGTSGNDLSSSVSDQTTTPVITLNVPTASSLNRGALSAADWIAFNSKQAEITLTTTGSSGAATFVGNVLNIPQYSGESGSVTSVAGTGTVSGITLSGNVTESGSLTLGGSLSLTSQEIINFLGYTPSSFDGDYDSLTNQPTIPAASAILANSGTPTLATGITAEEIRTLIGAGDGTGSIESVTGTAPIVSSGGANPAISISAATTSAAGSMSASDKTKLDGIDAGAQVNIDTDLSKTASATDVTINSSTGANVSIGAASTSSAGVMTSALYDNVIANNAKVSNVTTNLGYTGSVANGVVTSSDGTNATLPLVVSGGNAGLMTGTDKAKLDSVDALSNNFVKNTNDTFSASPKVNQIVTLTQTEYDNTNKYAEYLYIIVD